MKNVLFISVSIALLSSCKGKNPSTNGIGHIVLGDSSTIVTETDSAYLKNDYTEISIDTTHATMVATDITVPTDTGTSPEVKDTGTAKSSTSSSVFTTTINGRQITFADTKPSDARALGNNIISISNNKLPKSISLDANAKNHTVKYRKQTNLSLIIDGQKVSLDRNYKAKSAWVNAVVEGNNARINWNATKIDEVPSQALQRQLTLAIDRSNLSKSQKNKAKNAIKKINSVNHKQIQMENASYDIEWTGADANGKKFVNILSLNI